MTEKLTQLIDRFLSERRKSQYGGYAEVTTKDIEQLGRIIENLIKAKFEEDADGAYPVEYELTNRRESRRGSFMDLPYSHVTREERELDTPPTDDEKEEKYFDAAFFNLQCAMSDFNLAAKQKQYRRAKEREGAKYS